MNTSITIIGIIILALFLLPWVIISRSSKGTVKRLVKNLNSEASINELIISDCDSWGESTIGIDEKKNKIIYVDESHGDKDVKIFSLKDVEVFKTIPDLTNKKYQHNEYKKTNKVGLSFIFRERSRSDINITFYVAGFGGLSKKEEHIFEKWSEIIRKKLG